MSDGLSLSWSLNEAEKARKEFRLVSGILYGVDAAIGLWLLIGPASLSRLLLLGEQAQWPRVAGVLVLTVVALLWTGRDHADRSKRINLIGFAARFLLGIVLILVGGSLLWVGLYEAVVALVLCRFYYRYFSALVMSRP
jgi:uncharacterized membrane protein YiaA